MENRYTCGMMVIKFEHGQLIPDRGYWCEFCQTIHSARSCYHPAYRRMKILEQQNLALLEALKAISEVVYNDLINSKEKVSISYLEDVCRQAKQAIALAEGDKNV